MQSNGVIVEETVAFPLIPTGDASGNSEQHSRLAPKNAKRVTKGAKSPAAHDAAQVLEAKFLFVLVANFKNRPIKETKLIWLGVNWLLQGQRRLNKPY